jgi:hypothetical protein
VTAPYDIAAKSRRIRARSKEEKKEVTATSMLIRGCATLLWKLQVFADETLGVDHCRREPHSLAPLQLFQGRI